MKPTAESFGTIIDCRILHFKLYFWGFDERTVVNMARDLYSFTNALFNDECIVFWSKLGRGLKKNEQIINEEDLKQWGFYFDFFADVKTNTMNSIRAIRKHEKRLNDDNIFALIHYSRFASSDYSEYAGKYIDPKIGNLEQLRSAILESYNVENRVNRSVYENHDAYGGIYVSMEGELTELLAGHIDICISVYCFETSTCAFL